MDAPCDHWLPMVGMIDPPLPKDARWIIGLLPGGRVERVHWADGGGEEQPPYRGWFRQAGEPGDGFVQVPDPIAWRHEAGTCARCLAPLSKP